MAITVVDLHFYLNEFLDNLIFLDFKFFRVNFDYERFDWNKKKSTFLDQFLNFHSQYLIHNGMLKAFDIS